MSDPTPQNRVTGLKVSITKDPELKDSKTGKKYLKLNAIHEDIDTGSKTWLDVMAFGPIAINLAKIVAKGDRMLVSGTLKEQEFEYKNGPKAGQVGINKTILLSACKVVINGKPTVIDEFYEPVAVEPGGNEPF